MRSEASYARGNLLTHIFEFISKANVTLVVYVLREQQIRILEPKTNKY